MPPWERYQTGAPAAAPQGDTVIARDPYKQEDQQFQRDAAARAAADQARQDAAAARQADKDARDAKEFAATHDSTGKPLPKPSDAAATEAERKAAAFLIRALGSNDSYEAIDINKDVPGQQSIGPRSQVGQYLADNAPNALNSLPGAIGNSPERQVADTNQDEFIAASLRQDSGAAIPPEEMDRQRRIYFPMPGDGADVIEAKRQARLRAIEGLKQSAGRMTEEAMQRFGAMSGGITGTVTDTSGSPPAGVPPVASPPVGGGGGGLTLDQFGRGLAQGAGDIVESAGDFAGIIGNPLNATINAATGSHLSTDMGRTLREALSLPDNPNPIASAINKGGVGALTGSLIGRGASAVANPGAWRNALSMFGSTPGRDMLAGAGAGAGGEVGREVGGTPGQVVGTLVGGMAGYGGGNALMRQGTPRTPSPLMQKADDLNVTMMPADVGGAGTRMASGATKMTLGGIPMAEGAENAIGSASAARGKIAGQIGEVADNVGAGQAAKRGFEKFDKNSKARADELYGQVSVPADSDVQLGQTRKALEEVTRGMQSNPELSRLWANHPRLRATLEALTPEDTRQAGLVQHAAASDKVQGAESALQAARADAENTLHFERSQARDAVEQAHSAYDDLVSSARKDVTDAQSAYDAVRNQVVPATQQVKLQQAVQQAEQRLSAVRAKDGSIPEVSAAVKQIKDAEAGLDNLRFSEPKSDAMTAAQEALAAAKGEQDSAFVASRQAPQGGKLSWQDMKRFRSIVGEIVGQPGIQRDGSDIGALRKLYGALTSDMEVTAAHAGPKALQQFRRANQYWRGREGRIDDVFSALLGKDGNRSDEAVFKQINTWAKTEGGDFSRIARTIRSMPEDEADTIRSTIIQRMGQARPANQDAAGEVFSPALFSTQWRGMSDRAKNVLFPNQQHRQDLEKLADITSAMKRADEYSNTSKTSLGVNATAQAGLALAHPVIAAALAGLQFGAGKLLASPRFARIVASSAKLPPEQAGRKITEQLKVLATREPLIANDIAHVQQAISASPVARAAAEDERKDVRRK